MSEIKILGKRVCNICVPRNVHIEDLSSFRYTESETLDHYTYKPLLNLSLSSEDINSDAFF